MDQIVQLVGAVLILIAFAGVQFGRVDPTSRLYLWLNLIGSLVLTGLAYHDRQYGFLLLEGVWAIVSAWGVIQLARGRPPAGAH